MCVAHTPCRHVVCGCPELDSAVPNEATATRHGAGAMSPLSSPCGVTLFSPRRDKRRRTCSWGPLSWRLLAGQANAAFGHEVLDNGRQRLGGQC
jgi:hypothetical protein